MIEATVFKFEKPEEFKLFMNSYSTKEVTKEIKPKVTQPITNNLTPKTFRKVGYRKQTLDEFRTKNKVIKNMKGFLNAIEQHIFELAKNEPISISHGYSSFRKLRHGMGPSPNIYKKIKTHLKKSLILESKTGCYWKRK